MEPVEIQAPGRGAALAAAAPKTDGTAVEMAASGMIVEALPLEQEFAEPTLHNLFRLTAGSLAAGGLAVEFSSECME